MYPQARSPAFVENGAKAVRWTHRHVAQYGGRSECMLLVGHSASVHIAALRTLHKAYLKLQNVPLLAIRGMSGSSSPMTSCR